MPEIKLRAPVVIFGVGGIIRLVITFPQTFTSLMLRITQPEEPEESITSNNPCNKIEYGEKRRQSSSG